MSIICSGRLCRICAHTSDELISVFEDRGMELQLLEKIHIHLPVTVKPEDLLPVTICTTCVSKLEICHEFVKCCLDAEEELIKLLGLKRTNEVLCDEADINTIEDSQIWAINSTIDIKDEEQEISSFHQYDENYIEYADDDEVFHDDATDPVNYTDYAEYPEEGNTQYVSDEGCTQSSSHEVTEHYPVEPELNNELSEDLMLIRKCGLEEENLDCIVLIEKMGINQVKLYTKKMSSGAPRRKTPSTSNVKTLKQKISHQQKPKRLKNETSVKEYSTTIDGIVNSTKDLLQIHFCSQTVTDMSLSEVISEGGGILENHIHNINNDKCTGIGNADVEKENKVTQNPAKIIQNIENIIKRNELVLATDSKKLNVLKPKKKEAGKVPKEVVKVPKVKVPKPVKTIEPKLEPKVEKKFYKCKHCSQLYTTRDAVLKHAAAKHEIHECQFCFKKFKKVFYLQKHVELHISSSYSCDHCDKLMISREAYENHLKLHNEVDIFLCEKCGIKFSSKKAFASHSDKHEMKTYLCEKCGRSLKTLHGVRTHICDGDPSLHQCTFCDKSFKDRPAFRRHISVHSNERRYICEHCGDRFRLGNHLRVHLLRHTNPRHHKCPICGKGFNRRQHLKAHVATHQRTGRYMCRICNRGFEYSTELIFHRRSHSEAELKENFKSKTGTVKCKDLEFVCNICGKLLASSTSLKCHLSLHDDVKPFSCEICGKNFSLEKKLKVHKELHNVNAFRCETCGKGFARKIKLEVHERYHTGERPYSCKYCDKSFEVKYKLQFHERMHTGETPYICMICDKKFNSQSNLRSHIPVHSNMRPFKCVHCGKGFKRKSALNIHLVIHSGKRPHVCKVCGRGFTQAGDCRKHEKLHNKNSFVKESNVHTYEEMSESD